MHSYSLSVEGRCRYEDIFTCKQTDSRSVQNDIGTTESNRRVEVAVLSFLPFLLVFLFSSNSFHRQAVISMHIYAYVCCRAAERLPVNPVIETLKNKV